MNEKKKIQWKRDIKVCSCENPCRELRFSIIVITAPGNVNAGKNVT